MFKSLNKIFDEKFSEIKDKLGFKNDIIEFFETLHFETKGGKKFKVLKKLDTTWHTVKEIKLSENKPYFIIENVDLDEFLHLDQIKDFKIE